MKETYAFRWYSLLFPYKGCEGADFKNLPNAHKMADSVLCLPMHHALKGEDIERIIAFVIN